MDLCSLSTFVPKKVVVLTGFKTVKEALVNHAVEFGEREISPIFYDFNEGQGVLFSNGDSWKEMRRFALSTLRDLGMGKRGSEEKIIEEIHYMSEVFENFKGEPFDTLQVVNYSVSNIISSIVYGSRFKYDDPEFQRMVIRANENIRLTGSPAIQMAEHDTIEEQKTHVKGPPYTDAVTHEIQRLANIVPMSLPHITSCDVVFQGYHIKKGTTVIPLLTSVLYDESEWETPHTFNPGHFLDDQGRFRKRDAFMPFSAGRRVCPGESLARMELFLFFTSLLQKFRLNPPPGVSESDLDLTPVVGVTLNPYPQKLCALIRR
ncbi:cytochrome P450 2K1-like [Brienomyrus brachyistius]|uniref:cytochrome P450 2K1-like n=1 Tax=Brienomyrus brachyistius TaxID=42636 RepID=UPI0020B40EC9|nr:cytochrome P450 2K1-like [Brienomyrus brachyistius]